MSYFSVGLCLLLSLSIQAQKIPFDYSTSYTKVEKDAKKYLIDTTGKKWLLAERVSELGPGVKALDLSGQAIDSIPATVFQHKRLELLLIADNPITQLPKEIGQLKHLKVLVLPVNQISGTELEQLKTLLHNCEIRCR